jgi:ADP-ribose pyrophosphatase YjhB (NUDIX family)
MKNRKAALVRLLIRLVRAAQTILGFLTRGRFPPFCSALALIVKNDAIYVIDHAVYHRCTLPGGYLRLGESPRAAVEREILEETGARARPVRLIGCYENTSGIHSVNVVYLCEIEGEAEKFSYEGRCHWLRIEEAYASLPRHCQLALDDYRKNP